jgi:hypothetical protein
MIFSMEPLQKFSQMPIWARLAFAEMIPETYFWNEDMTDPRHPAEATVLGFHREDNVIWISFDLDWDDDVDRGIYIWQTVKT